MAVLQGVRALLKCRADGSVDSKAAIARVLEGLGAKTCSRLSKDVTHIIFQKPTTATIQEKLAQEQEIKQLYDSIMHGRYSAQIVSPLWVRCSADQRCHAQESDFVIPRPADPLLDHLMKPHTPGSAPGSRKRHKSFQPKPAEVYQVDAADASFSSSQLMADEPGAADAGELPNCTRLHRPLASQGAVKASALSASPGKNVANVGLEGSTELHQPAPPVRTAAAIHLNLFTKPSGESPQLGSQAAAANNDVVHASSAANGRALRAQRSRLATGSQQTGQKHTRGAAANSAAESEQPSSKRQKQSIQRVNHMDSRLHPLVDAEGGAVHASGSHQADAAKNAVVLSNAIANETGKASDALLGSETHKAGNGESQLDMKMPRGKAGRAGKGEPSQGRLANSRGGKVAASGLQTAQEGPERPAFSLAPGRPLQEPPDKMTARPGPLRRLAKTATVAAKKDMPAAHPTSGHAAAHAAAPVRTLHGSAKPVRSAAQKDSQSAGTTPNPAAAGPMQNSAKPAPEAAQKGKQPLANSCDELPVPSKPVAKPKNLYRNVRAKVDTGRTRAKTGMQQFELRQAQGGEDAHRKAESQSVMPVASDKAGAAELHDDGADAAATLTAALQPGMLPDTEEADTQQADDQGAHTVDVIMVPEIDDSITEAAAQSRHDVRSAGSPINWQAAARMVPQSPDPSSQVHEAAALSPIENHSGRPPNSRPSRLKLEQCATSAGHHTNGRDAVARTLAGRCMRSSRFSSAPALPQGLTEPGNAAQPQIAAPPAPAAAAAAVADQLKKMSGEQHAQPSPKPQLQLAEAPLPLSGRAAKASCIKAALLLPQIARPATAGTPQPASARRTRASLRAQSVAAPQPETRPDLVPISVSDAIMDDSCPAAAQPLPPDDMPDACAPEVDQIKADWLDCIPEGGPARKGKRQDRSEYLGADAAVKSCRRSARKRKTSCPPSDVLAETAAQQTQMPSKQGLPSHLVGAKARAAAQPMAPLRHHTSGQILMQHAGAPDAPESEGMDQAAATSPNAVGPTKLSEFESDDVMATRQASVPAALPQPGGLQPTAALPLRCAVAPEQSAPGRQGCGLQATSGQHPSTADGSALRRSSRQQRMGCLAVSSVHPDVKALAEKACRRLPGMRLSTDEEETCITHLILGMERRTMKVLLAIANGAWIVKPSWLLASMEAGCWVEEQPHQAEVRFSRGAERARSMHNDAVEETAPLQGVAVNIQVAPAAGHTSNRRALRILVNALGGKVVLRDKCSICILTGGAQQPSDLPDGVPCLLEEWLLNAAEQYRLPAFTQRLPE
ncbi:hypothetical protein WJX74_001816 [Apatococcus lobatus]|uniref:BRCT domain-containing protein n=1 Tax=Apatococcus lobatus TaxID=904363 RepID=A0AAW1RXN4_9CHLO